MKNNKIFKIILTLVITVTSFFTAISNIFAETVPNTINVASSTAVKGLIGDNVNFGTKTLADGTFAYCLDYHKITTENTTGTLVGEMDAGIAYLIENGYPQKTITGNDEIDYYITQTAIWWYLDETTGSKNLDEAFKTTDSDQLNLRSKIKTLVNDAITAKNKGYKNPKISSNITSGILTISEDKKYYISEEIKVTATDVEKYDVTLENAPEGSYVSDLNGNKITTFKAGENFRVYVPADKVEISKTTIKVSISSGTIYNKVYEYKPPTVQEQNLVPSILYPTTVKIATAVELNVASSLVSITKIDAETKKPLAGATLVIKDKDGKVVETFTTTEEVHNLYNLADGVYTVEETEAPKGYQTSDKKYTFTIDEENRTANVTFENYPSFDVPNTNSSASIMYILGALIIISGIGFAVYNAKKQK